MINITDIIEIFVLALVILIPLGMMLGRRLPGWKRAFAARFLSPRYLTPITARSTPITAKSLAAHPARGSDQPAPTSAVAAKEKSNTPS